MKHSSQKATINSLEFISNQIYLFIKESFPNHKLFFYDQLLTIDSPQNQYIFLIEKLITNVPDQYYTSLKIEFLDHSIFLKDPYTTEIFYNKTFYNFDTFKTKIILPAITLIINNISLKTIIFL